MSAPTRRRTARRHGRWNSRGWSGVLVEPQPDLAAQLRSERRAKVYAVACSTPENAGKTLTLYLAGIQSSLEPDFYAAGMRREGATSVPVMTLDDVLRDAGAPQPLDFVSIDVEGHDIDVLAGFDLAHWRPRLLFIEDVVQSLRLHRYITARGYRWFRRTGINSWYAPADAPIAVGLFGRMQFLRKYYLGLPFRILRDKKKARAASVTSSRRHAQRDRGYISPSSRGLPISSGWNSTAAASVVSSESASSLPMLDVPGWLESQRLPNAVAVVSAL